MSILDRFNSKNTSVYARRGATVNTSPEPWPGSSKTSELHYYASITGCPSLSSLNYIKKTPSGLDLDGEKPLNNYRDNAPEDASF